jgi:hypothetical protein
MTDLEPKAFWIVRKQFSKIISRAQWKSDIENDALVIISPPSTSDSELADQLLDIAMQLKEQHE